MKKSQPEKLTRPGIEHGPASWEATMLPLDQSGGQEEEENTREFNWKASYYNINSCPTQGREEGWDAMKPLYLRWANSKDVGRPRLMHHHRDGWNLWHTKKRLIIYYKSIALLGREIKHSRFLLNGSVLFIKFWVTREPSEWWESRLFIFGEDFIYETEEKWWIIR